MKRIRTSSRTGSTRRGSVRRNVARQDRRAALWRVIHHPAFLPDCIIGLLFVLLMGGMFIFVQDPQLESVDRVMRETRVVRTEFSVPDEQLTEIERRKEREKSPSILDADAAGLEAMQRELQALPETLRDVESLDNVSPEIRERYSLTEEQLQSIRRLTESDDSLRSWTTNVAKLVDHFTRFEPVLTSADFQNVRQDPSEMIELRNGDGQSVRRLPDDVINLDSPDFRDAIVRIANNKDINGLHADIIVQRLLSEGRPTHVLNPQATEEAREARAANVPLVEITHREGDIIYLAGETLDLETYVLAQQEHDVYLSSLTMQERIGRALAAMLVVMLLAGVTAAYLRMDHPRVLTRPWRLAMMSTLIAIAALLGVWIITTYPGVMWFGIVGPTAFVGMIGVIAYDRRLSLVIATVQSLIVILALGLPVSAFAVGAVAAAVAAWRFQEIRDRRDMIFGAFLTSVAAFITLIFVELLVFGAAPITQGIQAGIGAFLAGVAVLVILPYVEQFFDITTGMTLTELRDSRQPLLRELQQRAPGTYSHSLNVAALAEAAADAIGADSRHTYVGALYHDVGKMNKPDYFVENQARGQNRHSKLSPAMSLLVIVGHVKDGMEIAREYALPRSLHHYIEAHHGTTLVEYFYDQARRQADEDDTIDAPAEVEYRYPGPRPRTREAAVLMLCDAVESATRAMGDPTPARIKALVTEIARRRLLDGQFDESSLTIAEIKVIEEVVTKQLCSMYHGRIAYPTEEKKKDDARDESKRAASN